MNSVDKVILSILFVFFLAHSNQAEALVEVAPGKRIYFSEPEGGRDKKNAPVAGMAFAQEEHGESKLRIGSAIILSTADDTGYARGTLYSEFRVSGDEQRSLSATVTGNASWKGYIQIAPLNVSSYSRISITASLWDMTDDKLAGSTNVLREQCDGEFYNWCYLTPSSDRDFTFSAKIVMGHKYELRLSAQCTTAAGLAADNVTCDFYGSNKYIKWNNFEVAIEDDIIGLIDELSLDHRILGAQIQGLDNDHYVLGAMLEDLIAGQEEITAGQEQIRTNQEVIRAAQEEIIELLNTPEGQRPGWNKKD